MVYFNYFASTLSVFSLNIVLQDKAFGVLNTKWLYISTAVLFEAGSALCGAAPNMNALILGRVIG